MYQVKIGRWKMSDGATEMLREELITPTQAELIKRNSVDDDTDEEEAFRTIEERIQKQDMVNHPPHYTQHKWEVIEVLEEYFPYDPLLFNVGKYILRSPYKGNELQDLSKALWYLSRKIDKLKGLA
jgi:hypothetical protein